MSPTPTPWSVRPLEFDDIGFIRGPAACLVAVTKQEGREDEDAAFICLAVNAHAALVAALEGLLEVCKRRGGTKDQFSEDLERMAAARAALALARGQ